MSNFNKNIDKLVLKILNEEIEGKVKELSKKIKQDEWSEIKMDEELKGNQYKIDVAKPKGEITSADFKKLRNNKKHKEEVEEQFFYDDEENMRSERSHASRKPKIMVSFDDQDFDDDDDDDEFEDYSGLMLKYLDMDEEETKEGNAFTGALADAKKDGEDSFEVDGKKYQVKETEEKWIQKIGMKKGALHKKLGVPEGDKIPKSKLQSLKKELIKKSEGGKKLSLTDSKLLKQVNLALTLKNVKESVNYLRLSEDELIDMIENIVIEQKVKDKAETTNLAKKESEGLEKTNKVLKLNKKENDDYAKEVVGKMKDYMKDMFMGDKGYEENPEGFPESNYDMEKKHNEMKYNPSDAVEEYIEAFAYPGMTNLVYDEIKPDDKKISKYIKGDSTTGNAITDKDGKTLGNVSKSSITVGDRFKKNYDENLYGAEQMNVSYKRQSQPVDVAGEDKISGSLSSKRGGKSSTEKAQRIMNKLESTQDKKSKIISEEMNKMKNLISYDRKTQ
jgi:hypothetical protein